ncbi:hypothetical protein ID866_4841 [Astraeus odoratus]|nr:hypothetical protein ID866_4841 [Astraeus odoratus]
METSPASALVTATATSQAGQESATSSDDASNSISPVVAFIIGFAIIMLASILNAAGLNLTKLDHGTIIVVVGVIGIVAFGNINSGLSSETNVEHLTALWRRGGWLAFFFCMSLALFLLLIFTSSLDAVLAARSDLNSEPFSGMTARRPPIRRTTFLGKIQDTWSWSMIWVKEKLEAWTAPQDDKRVAWVLGIGWACCGGGLAGGCLVFAKATVKLLTGSLSHENPGNQFGHLAPIFTIILLAVTAILQIICLNRGLKVYDSTLVVPVFYGVYTATGFLDSLIFNDEVGAYKSWTLFLIFSSIMVLISGVVLLTSKKPEQSHRASTAPPLPTTFSRGGTHSTVKLGSRTDDPREDNDDEEQALRGSTDRDPGERALWQLGDMSDDEDGLTSGRPHQQAPQGMDRSTSDIRSGEEENSLLMQEEEAPQHRRSDSSDATLGPTDEHGEAVLRDGARTFTQWKDYPMHMGLSFPIMANPPEETQEKEIDELEDDFQSDDENVDPTVFRITDPLTPPSAMSYSAQELHTFIHEGYIDLNPTYQRDVVWPESKQIGLIDSIFRNFYIPPVIFAVQKDEDGEVVRVCVDGKQRLTSIQKFLDGLIPHRDAKTKKSFWFVRSEQQKTTRMEIPEVWKRRFSETRITCVEYHDLAPGTEREIFQRVQLGMSLTAAEKLQAISSPWSEWLADLHNMHVNMEGGLAQALEWDTKRGRDFQCIAQMVYCCDSLPDQALPTAQKLEKWLSRVDKPTQAFKKHIGDALNAFWHIANTESLNNAFKQVEKRVAPVEFVFIGTLLYILRDRDYYEQATAILHMRLRIREQFRDVRNNGAVGKALWSYIDSITGPNGLRVLEIDKTRVAEVVPSSSKKKRKHPDEDDDEYHPSPIRNLGQGAKTRARLRQNEG